MEKADKQARPPQMAASAGPCRDDTEIAHMYLALVVCKDFTSVDPFVLVIVL